MSAFKGTRGFWVAMGTHVENATGPILFAAPVTGVEAGCADVALAAVAPQMLAALLEARDFVKHMRTGAGHTNAALESQIESILAALREAGAL